MASSMSPLPPATRSTPSRCRSVGAVLVDEHDFTEPRWNVGPRLVVLRVGPDAHAAVRLHPVPAIEIRLPARAVAWWAARQLLEVRPRDHRFEAPAAVGIGAHVERPP